MRLSAEEKVEIVEIVKRSELGVNRTLEQLGIHKRTFYNWYHAYNRGGIDSLKGKRQSKRQWNSIPEEQKNLVVELALDYPEESPRILATRIIDEQGVFISESSVYRILKAKGLVQEAEHWFLNASDEFHTKTCFVNEMWQTDFTYFKIVG
ncbi:MAG: helix-turn-helix domain containing protein [Dysgonamonadaceae bacterium]|nr:helix-turn-helix domain containing protein [Dysgonamonadaceae bacterium]